MIHPGPLVSDEAPGIARALLFWISPAVLVLPLAVAAAMPNRATDSVARVRVRSRLVVLVFSTFAALAIWGGATAGTSRFAWMHWVAEYAWLLHTPLIAALAMPILRLKGHAWAGETPQDAAGTRTAALGNRARHSPVKPSMWFFAVVAWVSGAILVGVRFMIAPEEPVSWMPVLLSTTLAMIELAVLPTILRAMLIAPEPMDLAGSRELSALYARERRLRILGMFWLMGVGTPAVLGMVCSLLACFPDSHAIWGVVGSIGAVLLGSLIAIYGFRTMAGYARVAQLRAGLGRVVEPSCETGTLDTLQRR